MTKNQWIVVGFVIAFAAFGVWYRSGKQNPRSPHKLASPNAAVGSGTSSDAPGQAIPILRACGDFELLSLDGRPFGKDELSGRAWVSAVIPSNSDQDVTAMIRACMEIRRALEDRSVTTTARLILFSVGDLSPTTRKQIEALSESGAAISLQTLIATQQQARAIGESLCGASSTDLEQFTAGKLLVVVDPQGDVRTLHRRFDKESLQRVAQDMRWTLLERFPVQNKPSDDDWVAQTLLEPPWLETRRTAQLAAAKKYEVAHDFAFQDRRKESGITFRHRIVDDAGRNYVKAHYDHGNGLAVADVDMDGLLDILCVNQVGGNELWRNRGDGNFENSTDKSGVRLADRVGVSASFADIDNDGDADLYVTTVRHGNVLLENDGRGIFRDISVDAGVNYVGHSSSAEFFDFDRDGLLDLFVVNVGKYTTDKVAEVVNDRFTGPDTARYSYFVSNPDAFAAHLKPLRSERSRLYRNLGNNRFQDVTEAMQLGDESWTGDATPFDANQDGWPDLYLVNMQGHDEYYENDGGRRFIRRSREVFPSTPWGSMGVKAFDFDNDGDQDLFITDMHTDMQQELSPLEEKNKIPIAAFDRTLMATDGNHIGGNAFFRNDGPGAFLEISEPLHAENYWPWGLSVGDLNADGFDDAFLTASMNFPFRYAVNSVMLNDRGRQFLDSEFAVGVEPRRSRRTAIPWFEVDLKGRDRRHPIANVLRERDRPVDRAVVWGALGSRSSAILDLENDGDLDIVTNDFNSPPMVLVSNLAERTPVHFLKINLVGTKSNRDGLGATVRVIVDGQTYTKVNDGQSGYLSQSRMPLYFGLGGAEAIQGVEVTWPSGEEQSVTLPIQPNTTLEIRETAATP